jgi:arylsulfatase A-like enzyme
MRFVLLPVSMLLLAAPLATAEMRPPNIVYIVSDDQGYADLPATNAEVIAPALDRLCREGTRLTNFYVAWPACTPSRGALLTGRYPQRNGIYDMIRNEAPDYGHKYSPAEYAVTFERIGGMDEREILLPKLLQSAGYRSAIFGKWDLGMQKRYLPLARGFDEFYGLVNTGIDYYTHERYGVPSMFRNNSLTEEDKGTYCTDLFRREAVRFIRENKDRPFFLYLPFNAPHGASSLDPKIRGAAQAPEKYKKLYPQFKDSLVTKTRNGKPTDGPSAEKVRLEYLASITCMDEAIGEVLGLLDEFKLADNTIVIFISDNGGGGGSNNSPLKGKKATVWEGGLRVCGTIRYPGHIPAGTVNDEFLTTLDLFPMLLNLAGAKPPESLILDGSDCLATLVGEAPSPRREKFWKRRDLEAARLGNWKWVRIAGESSLYDLSQDVGERHDLSQTFSTQAAEMQRRFEKWLAEMDAAEPRGPFKDY